MFAIMWMVGAVLAVLGLRADSSGWWRDRPFLLNLVSATTGFLFGAPIVISLFDAVAGRVERDARRNESLIAIRNQTELLVRQWRAEKPAGFDSAKAGGELTPVAASWLHAGKDLGVLSDKELRLLQERDRAFDSWQRGQPPQTTFATPRPSIVLRLKWLTAGAALSELSDEQVKEFEARQQSELAVPAWRRQMPAFKGAELPVTQKLYRHHAYIDWLRQGEEIGGLEQHEVDQLLAARQEYKAWRDGAPQVGSIERGVWLRRGLKLGQLSDEEKSEWRSLGPKSRPTSQVGGSGYSQKPPMPRSEPEVDWDAEARANDGSPLGRFRFREVVDGLLHDGAQPPGGQRSTRPTNVRPLVHPTSGAWPPPPPPGPTENT